MNCLHPRQGDYVVIASNTTIWSIGLLLSSLPLFQGFDMKAFDFKTPPILTKVESRSFPPPPQLAPILHSLWAFWRPLPSSCKPKFFWRPFCSSSGPPTPIILLYVGRLHPYFNVHTLPIIFCRSVVAWAEFWRPLETAPPAMRGLQGLSFRH